MVNKKNESHIITVLSFVVFIILGLACASTPSFAPKTGTSMGFSYEYKSDDKTCVITTYNGKNKEVNIPAKLGGRTVVEIKKSAFSNNQLTSITIPDSVTSIGESAFANNQLTSITIPDSVTSIGESAFANNQLTNVNLPGNLKSMGKNAFFNNPLINLSLNINNDVTSIGSNAFRDNQLTSVTIPDGVTVIHGNAFKNNQLTSVTIPGSVRFIDNAAFLDNPLTSITIDSDPNSKELKQDLINGVSLTVPNNSIYITSSSLGNISWAYAVNNKLPGTYTKSGEDVLFNGLKLPKPAILTTGANAWLVSIDGKLPLLYCFEFWDFDKDRAVSKWQSRSSIESKITGRFPYPSGINQFCQGSFYLSPGTHAIEVIYLKETSNAWSFSSDTTVWENRFLFQGFKYVVTVDELPDNRLTFSIKLQ